jgi:hypothetical protein
MRAIIPIVLSLAAITHAAEPTFPAGEWSLTTVAAYGKAIDEQHQDIPSLSVGLHYNVIDNLSLGVVAGGLYVDQPDSDAGAVSLSAALRHHIVDWGGTTLFLDVSSGPMQASNEVPIGGTHFNFITRAGVGMTHRVDERIELIVGLHWFHISNARLHGEDENPGNDGIEAYVGLLWRL